MPALSRRASRRVLWLCFVLTVPVPFWAFEGGRVPTAWLIELAAFTGALFWTEGGTVPLLGFALFFGEAVIATAAMWLLARLAVRVLAGRSAEPAVGAVAAVVAAFLLLAFLQVYRTPFVAEGRAVNIVELFA